MDEFQNTKAMPTEISEARGRLNFKKIQILLYQAKLSILFQATTRQMHVGAL